jgi:hypothetical protein
MKKFVAFKQYNAMDYLGSDMVLCDSQDEAEYEVVLQDGDKLVESDEGVSLIRCGVWFSQITKMNTFKSVGFSHPENESIKLKLIKCVD